MDSNSEDIHREVSKSKITNEIRIEPPVPVEHIIKTNVKTKKEPALKVDSGNTISKDAINKEDEELEKRPEIELLDKLKNHENEEKKILTEPIQKQKQFEKKKRKPIKQLKDSNLIKPEDKNIIISEKKMPIEDVVKDKLPLPLVMKEAKKSNKTKIETIRDKRDLSSTMDNGNDSKKEENCDKNDKVENENPLIKNDNNQEKNIENMDVKN